MARIEKGNTLKSPLLQPGYSIHNDGYGLLTCTATFKIDGDSKTKGIARGAVFTPDSRLKCHKSSTAYGPLGVATITAEYCGIEEGDWTAPNVSGSSSLTTESITSHPCFFSKKVGKNIRRIAGEPPYVAAFSVAKLAPYDMVYEGDNGAIFENADGGKFLGFYSKANNQAKKLYQRTSYLSPTSTFNGILYTTKAENAVKMKGYVGMTMNKRAPEGMRFLLPAYLGDNWQADDEDDQLMIANVHFEDYGVLYKITYELRYNAEGYPRTVYQGTNV